MDCEVLRVLVRVVLSDTPDRHGTGAARLRDKLVRLFGRVTAKVSRGLVVSELKYG